VVNFWLVPVVFKDQPKIKLAVGNFMSSKASKTNTARKTKVAKIETEKCKGCYYCIDVCGQNAVKKSGKSNRKGYDYVEIDETACNGCGRCYIVCPDCCITIIEND